MPEPDPRPELDHVADLLRRSFDAPEAAPLDPALIRLMLELSHAPDEAAPPARPRPARPARSHDGRALPFMPLLILRGKLRRGANP